jgi:hypothetical protein
MKLLVHASGYKNVPVFTNDQQEIRWVLHPKCGGLPDKHWSPSSKDMAAAGVGSGGSSPAASIEELLRVISQKSVESIEELRIIGHANDQWFAIAGEVRADDVYFTEPNALIGPSDAFKAAMPRFRDLQDRFTADARITLMGCNAGSGKETIMSIVSRAFLRKVAGFKDEIKYNFEWGPTGAAVKEQGKVVCVRMAANARILIRGRMMYNQAATDLADLFGDPTSNMGLFKTNVWLLEPDSFSNAGDIFIPVRRKDPGAGATELVGRILQEFYPAHPPVSGFSSDPKLSGLRVRKQDNHVFIDAGFDFVKNTTPRTLRNRVTEVGKALDLIRANSQGPIPLT